MARNIKFVLAYDGTAYCGWERQRDFPSIQQKLEAAIQSLTGETVHVAASGRTDAGVHALGQVANFHTESNHDGVTLHRALNALLPVDIRVRSVEEVPESFHATYSTVGKLYRYVIHDDDTPDPLTRTFVSHSKWPLDDAAMHRAAQCLVGTHDFSAFETAGSPRQTSIRTITHLAVFRSGHEQIWSCDRRAPSASDRSSLPTAYCQLPTAFLFVEIAADGFLYNMVRSIVGTLVNVGRGFWPEHEVARILESRDRRRAGPTAPAHGLMLVSVEYQS